MNFLISLFGAILPSVLILRYFIKKDLHPEPAGVIASTFFLGVLTVIPVLIVALPLEYINPYKDFVLHSAVYTAFLVAAVPEELFKFRVLTRHSAKNKAFDEPMDGIVYGVTASLGFATLENILYVSQNGIGTAIIRGLTAVPAHASWGALMGYFVGQAKFDKKQRVSAYLGLFAAILLHGLYDLPLMLLANYEADLGQHEIMDIEVHALLFFLAVFVFSVAWALSVVKRLNRRQRENRSQII